MTSEELLTQLSDQCNALRGELNAAAAQVREFNRRLELVLQQLHKNIPVRDEDFADQFNAYCHSLRKKMDALELFWTEARAQIRTRKEAEWTGDLALAAKGLNSRAKALARACDEFTTAYDLFCRNYKNFTAEKLNVWLLTSCQTDAGNLTGKILFWARDIAKKTERNRGTHAFI